MQAARELWAAACRRFLRCEDGGGAKSDKVHRASTYWWLMSIDHALRILTGHEQLAADGSPLSADARQHLADSLGADWPRRRLSVVADQCVVGVSAMTYADQVLGIKAGLIAGMPHRRWNSEKTRSLPAEGGGRSSSPQFFNVGYGPWLSASWAGALNAARAEMSQVAGVDCPLLTALLPAIARDKGMPDKAHDPSFRARVWAEISDSTGPLARKGPRMNMCRWYGWWDCFDPGTKYIHILPFGCFPPSRSAQSCAMTLARHLWPELAYQRGVTQDARSVGRHVLRRYRSDPVPA